MQELSVQTWQEFEVKLAELQAQRDALSSSTTLKVSDLIYRGQPNSEWKLETTLERSYGSDVDMLEYYRKVLATKPIVSTLTEREWSVPSFEKVKEWIDKVDPTWTKPLPAYEYLVYLRHHGFPSPLLDWTMSSFVAAYFAFADVAKNVEKVSVFVCLEHTGHGKSTSSDRPNIFRLGPYVKSHKRHFLQQCEYTVCVRLDNHGYKFTPHEHAFRNPASKNRQDQLWKIDIPAKERSAALKRLETMNVNAFSLFGSEDALIRAVAIREFFFKGKL